MTMRPKRRHGQSGQAVLVTVALLSAITATVIYLLSSYVTDLGRMHNRTRDAVLMHGIVETLGVRLRRAYDLAVVTSNSCEQPAGTVVGQFRMVAPAGVRLCLPVALTQICVPHPLESGQFCADFGLFVARRDAVGEVLEARVKPPDGREAGDLMAGLGVLFDRGARFASRFGITVALAQKSEKVYRPQPPPAGTVVNSLDGSAPGVASSTMTCGGAGNADCLTVRICDMRFPCSADEHYIYQRYAFPR